MAGQRRQKLALVVTTVEITEAGVVEVTVGEAMAAEVMEVVAVATEQICQS